MKILILNPPFLPKFSRSSRSPAISKSGTLYYPIWLAYTTGVLEKAGYDVTLIDSPARNWETKELLEWVKENKPDLVVIDTSTPSIVNDIGIGDEIKNILPNTFVIMVGTHVSALPEASLDLSKKVDAIARHEYDYTIRDLAYILKNKGDISTVEGITYRTTEGYKATPDRPFIENLDEIPFASEVYKKHLNIEDYFYSITQHPEITIITGRGCPFHCVYCVLPQTMNGHRYRYRSVKNVADEFEYIEKEFPQVKEIFIEDDTLTVNKKRMCELAEELIRRGTKIQWTANSRGDLDYETLKIMKKSNCRLLCVGFESGAQSVLDAMKKSIKVEQFITFSKAAKKAGVLIHGCFLVGNPGETKETLKITLELAKKLNPDTAQFYPVMVYPGTEAYNWARDNGYLITENYTEWLTDEGLHYCVVSRPDLTNTELVDFCDAARREFYLRPSYILFKFNQMLRHPNELKRTLKSFKTFSRHLFRNARTDKKEC